MNFSTVIHEQIPPALITDDIVIVDDQGVSRTALSRIVSAIDSQIKVHAFETGIEALEWTTTKEPVLILTDYKMPNMDGVDLIRRFRQRSLTQYVPIIMVSVAEERVVRQTALEAGATDFLTKPVDPDECRARCRNLMLISRQQKSLSEHCKLLEVRLLETTELLEKVVKGTTAGATHGCVTVEYEKLFELTSSVTAAEEMLSTIRASIDAMEQQLCKPLHGRRGLDTTNDPWGA